jgi:hypothetical protein
MTDTPRLDTLLAAQRMQDQFCGFSADEIERMPMDSYREIRRRAGLPDVDPYSDAYAKYETHGQDPAPAPQNAPGAPQSPPQGIDLQSMTMAQYAAVRGQLGVQGDEYGKGALDGGSTADWIAAAQRKAGRSGWQRGNVTESPRLTDRYINHDEQRDTRPAAQRFSNQANAFNL